jgi:hypothetical protein
VWPLVLVLACHRDAPQRGDARPAPLQPARDAAAAAVASATYADLATALHAIVPAGARVIGFGELHARTDRAQVKSALARFTSDALPAIGDQLSDLIVETWVVDPKCGKAAEEATAKVSISTRRPLETHSEIAELAQAARARGIQPLAMTVTCDDYARIAPQGKDVDFEAMLTLTTRELTRLAIDALAHRDAEPTHRPWIALYGGALHNDRFPAKGVEDWSYAAKVDAAAHGHFVEVDLIVPELAEDDPVSQKEPWFPLVRSADARVHAWKRGDRSFVLVLPRTAPAP